MVRAAIMSGLGTEALRKRLELDRVAGWTGSGRRTSESEGQPEMVSW